MMSPAQVAAHRAYEIASEEKLTTRPLYVVVDFTLPSNQKRLFVMRGSDVVYSTYVTHGSGSGRQALPSKFSNREGSHMSSIGVYLTAQTYTGKHGVSRSVDGLEYTNNQARNRSIVIHSASYIGNGKIGTSWGCFAVPMSEIDEVLEYTKPGTLLVAYYPDQDWLKKSRFLK